MAGTTPSGSPPFTPRAKKVLELSLREALQLGHSYIGTEHILLGLVREGEGVAATVWSASVPIWVGCGKR
jgi:ATP-dependent Clp protease ATP-binding subunit ClpC